MKKQSDGPLSPRGMVLRTAPCEQCGEPHAVPLDEHGYWAGTFPCGRRDSVQVDPVVWKTLTGMDESVN